MLVPAPRPKLLRRLRAVALLANTFRLLCERKRKEAAPIEAEGEENPCPATGTETKPPPSGSPICLKISESRICRFAWPLEIIY